MRPLEQGIGNFVTGLMSGSVTPFAKGGVISGGLPVPFASGGVIQSPLSFPLAADAPAWPANAALKRSFPCGEGPTAGSVSPPMAEGEGRGRASSSMCRRSTPEALRDPNLRLPRCWPAPSALANVTSEVFP